MKLKTELLSSLVKIFPDGFKGEKITSASTMRNEPFSFQVAFKCDDAFDGINPIYVRVESDLDINLISQYKVGYVPVTRADYADSDGFFERKTPGLYPDMLLERKTNAEISDVADGGFFEEARWMERDQQCLLCAVRDSYQSLWFTVNENGEKIKAGKYNIKVLFFDSKDRACIGEEALKLEVIDGELPKQSLYYTSWFHCDCIADTYGIEVFSERFFAIMRSFVTEAAKTGMNMILLPAFTPPLDTSEGEERKTAQLVSVSLQNGKYVFDFSLMKKYIEICRECGIENFEHSHFFTQWGAKHAPKIMATVDGEYKRIFGWDTDSASEEYAFFLKSYLKELKRFLKEMDLEDKILFHISDEPNVDVLPYYEKAQKTVGKELKDYMCGDALSHFECYKNGSVKKPIVIVSSEDMDKFVENCDDYWVYYTGAQLTEGYANRIIATTSARNRVIGLQMYVGGAKGFIHWGYNYYYDFLSHGLFNPIANPCGYNQLVGTSYVVYPDTSGKAIPSLRMKVLYEGINDYRALQKLESLIGREAVLEFIKDTIGEVNYRFCPTNSQMFEFRQKLNQEISQNIQRSKTHEELQFYSTREVRRRVKYQA